MGISSFIMSRLLRAKPFQSNLLDRLAETMLSTEILRKEKLPGYFKVHFLRVGCLSYSDALFFDSKFYDMLLPDELLAVGAHEYNHIIKRHGMQRFKRIFLPALSIGILLGVFSFFAYGFINSIVIFSQSLIILFSLFVALISFIFLLFAFYYLNAKWLCKQETQSDFVAVEFANGEALISALKKLSKLRPKKTNGFESRFHLKTYPTLDERIADIREYMEKKSKK